MFMRFRLNTLVQLVVVVGLAFGLKWYYSTASVDQLKWILTPTTRLVEVVSGRSFEFESRAGYMSSDHTFLIAASCAGVNFLITAFLMLSLARLWRAHRSREKLTFSGWSVVPISAVVSYVATVLANTVRISVALQLRESSLKTNALNADQLHRLEGIFVYFGFLLLLFVCSENLSRTRMLTGGRELSKKSFLPMSRYLFPMLIYYGVTLGLPLVNGAYSRGTDFWEHSLFVVITPLILIFGVEAFRIMVRSRSTDFHRLHRLDQGQGQ
jgi:exosortase K